ncbi:ERF family protein [Ligilactobacillus saerimneri]
MSENNELSKLQEALSVFRAQVKQPALDGSNPYFNSGYVTLAGVQKAVDEGIKGTGLAYVQLVSSDDNGNVYVETIITHKLGGILRSGKLSIPPKKRDAQGLGSSITYSRRYQLAAMFGITSDKDDDANAAVGGNPNQGRKQAPKQQSSKANQQLRSHYLKLIADLENAFPKSNRQQLEARVRTAVFNNANYTIQTNEDFNKVIEFMNEQLRKSNHVK